MKNMTGMKFYTIIASVFLLLSILAALVVYCVRSERKIKELEKVTQTQQITIETNNKRLERQKILLKQNQQLQKKINELQNKNKQKQEQRKKTLEEADLIEEKQVLFHNVWD